MLLSTTLLMITASIATGEQPLWSIGTLRYSPEGFHYPLEHIRGFISESTVIVRAVASSAEPYSKETHYGAFQNDRSTSSTRYRRWWTLAGSCGTRGCAESATGW